MKHHRPAIMHMDGVEWVEKSAYDAALAELAEKQRSTASHNRWFAHINDMFENLPAAHAQAPYAASKHAFRKHGLIQGGFCDVTTLDMESHEAALSAAPFIADLARQSNAKNGDTSGYALVIVRGSLVICTTPHSQSFKAMGKERFQESVAACEDWAERLIGVKIYTNSSTQQRKKET